MITFVVGGAHRSAVPKMDKLAAGYSLNCKRLSSRTGLLGPQGIGRIDRRSAACGEEACRH
jgi:hypothetical protein